MNTSQFFFRCLRPALLSAPLLFAACAPQPSADETASSATATPQISGDWRLVEDASQLSFVSIKNNAVTEVHRFHSLSGSVSEQGDASLSVDLNSVDTGIEIRDQRLRELLFETTLHPQAEVSLKLDPAQISTLEPGQFKVLDSKATLALHGLSMTVPASLRVSRLDARHWLVTSEQPVIVNAAQFNLLEGLEKLREVAGLKAIGAGSPVTFSLLFKRG